MSVIMRIEITEELINSIRSDVLFYSVLELSKKYNLSHRQLYYIMKKYNIKRGMNEVHNYVVNELLKGVSIEKIGIDFSLIAKLLIGKDATVDDLKYINRVKDLYNAGLSSKNIKLKICNEDIENGDTSLEDTEKDIFIHSLSVKKINSIIKKYVLWQS